MTTLEAFIVFCLIFLIIGGISLEKEENRRRRNGL